MLVLPIKRKSGLVIFQFLNFWPHFSFMWKCYWNITACWTHINSGICAESNHTQLNWLGRVHRAFDIWGQMFKSESWRSWHVSDRKELTRYTAPTISHTVLTDLSPFQYIIHHIRRRACLFISLLWGKVMAACATCQVGKYLIPNLDPCSVLMSLLFWFLTCCCLYF